MMGPTDERDIMVLVAQGSLWVQREESRWSEQLLFVSAQHLSFFLINGIFPLRNWSFSTQSDFVRIGNPRSLPLWPKRYVWEASLCNQGSLLKLGGRVLCFLLDHEMQRYDFKIAVSRRLWSIAEAEAKLRNG